MSKPAILLAYGLDENSHGFEVDSTLQLVLDATLALKPRGWRVMPLQITHDLAGSLKPYDPAQWVVLNLCEGSPQQDFYYAQVAETLGQLGYSFTGSDAWSLEETQYKWRMKELLDQARLATPRWDVCDSADTLQFDAFPAIVKPAAEHCSYGITRDSVVLNLAEARRQANRIISEFKQPALIEEFLDGAEYNVSVWGSAAHPKGFEVLGISTMTYDYFSDIHDRLCTFDAKWTPGSEAYQHIPAICPAPLAPDMQMSIERLAIDAYIASNCRDYGRVDIRLKPDPAGGPGTPMVLDVNANCDVSNDAGFMNAARAKGMNYGEMLERIVELAIVRGPQNRSASGLRRSPERRSGERQVAEVAQ